MAIGDQTADLDLLERALDRLSLADRTLLALHHFEHPSRGEIGERLGVPGKTVKSRLCTSLARTRADLRADLRADFR